MHSNTKHEPLSVSEFTGEIKNLLEDSLPPVWICGEITNFRPARSGHWYFSLTDGLSQIRVNMWRSATLRIDFQPKEGSQVLIYGAMNVYAPRGEYSLIAEWMEPRGKGSLRAEFERLKKQLLKEGLFDEAHKKKLPFLPGRIGVVTSATGAALKDILNVLNLRFPSLTVVVSDSKVQGKGAAEELAKALKLLDQLGNCDVIILGRGGGSEEDLWAFNEEVLARAIFNAHTPVVSAVGHETDFTIADFVADLRAATPSQAAERVIKTRQEYLNMVSAVAQRLKSRMENRLHVFRQQFQLMNRKEVFQRFVLSLNDRRKQVDFYQQKLEYIFFRHMEHAKFSSQQLQNQLQAERLIQKTSQLRKHVESVTSKMKGCLQKKLRDCLTAYSHLDSKLEALSPLKVLARGYSVLRLPDGTVIRHSAQVEAGQELTGILAEGELCLRVTQVKDAKPYSRGQKEKLD